MLTERDHIFDGFCHRPFNPDIDGWRNELIEHKDYPAIGIAKDIMAMAEEIDLLRKEVWQLTKENEHLNEMLGLSR